MEETQVELKDGDETPAETQGPTTERDILVVAERLAKEYHERFVTMFPHYFPGLEAPPWEAHKDAARSHRIEVMRQLLKDGVITAEPVDA